MTTHWHAYAIRSIDFGWNCLDTVDDAIAKVGNDDDFDEGTSIYGVIALQESFNAAQTAARHVGWEGDFRLDARVFWFPDCDSVGFVCGFVWQQDYEGKCFVISPYVIPGLDYISYTHIDIPDD